MQLAYHEFQQHITWFGHGLVNALSCSATALPDLKLLCHSVQCPVMTRQRKVGAMPSVK